MPGGGRMRYWYTDRADVPIGRVAPFEGWSICQRCQDRWIEAATVRKCREGETPVYRRLLSTRFGKTALVGAAVGALIVLWSLTRSVAPPRPLRSDAIGEAIIYGVDPFSEGFDGTIRAQVPHRRLSRAEVDSICAECRAVGESFRPGRMWKGGCLLVTNPGTPDERRFGLSYYGGFIRPLDETGYFRASAGTLGQVFARLHDDNGSSSKPSDGNQR